MWVENNMYPDDIDPHFAHIFVHIDAYGYEKELYGIKGYNTTHPVVRHNFDFNEQLLGMHEYSNPIPVTESIKNAVEEYVDRTLMNVAQDLVQFGGSFFRIADSDHKSYYACNEYSRLEINTGNFSSILWNVAENSGIRTALSEEDCKSLVRSHRYSKNDHILQEYIDYAHTQLLPSK